jgi:Cu(I)/Ag(I) efflux system membrane protein CusA/SilA
VVSVAGKIGRADSATDPAPLSMVETTVRLKPRREWRQIDGRPMTLAELTREMDEKLRLPGWTNAWTYPVKTRVDMMATGIRTPVGIKVFGRSLADIDRVGQALEPLLRGISGTRSVFYERTLGGLYVDVIPRRDDLVRHGVGLGELLELVEIGVGGAPVATTLDGRARLSISVRFPQDLRADRDALAAMLVPLGEGRALPLSQLADVVVAHGPAMVRDEDGHLCAYVYVDIDEEARDLGAWVAEARALVEKGLMRPAGTFLQWSGQVEELDALSARLKLVVPLTLLIVLLLLVLHFKNLVEAVIVLLSVPFALVGSVWMLWLLDYRLSTAVWVGMIALVGLAAQTGIVMIVYIDHAYEKRRRAGKIRTLDDVIWAHLEGTVLRVRPKLMTVAAMLAGLVPLLWAEGSGADVMKRIAAPMVGGLLSSAFLTLEIIPVLYTYWRGEQLLHERVPPERRRRLRAAAIACGWSLVAVLVAAALPFYVDLGRLWPLVVTGAALALSIAAYLRARVGYRSAP